MTMEVRRNVFCQRAADGGQEWADDTKVVETNIQYPRLLLGVIVAPRMGVLGVIITPTLLLRLLMRLLLCKSTAIAH
jgi:hypothetical protein